MVMCLTVKCRFIGLKYLNNKQMAITVLTLKYVKIVK